MSCQTASAFRVLRHGSLCVSGGRMDELGDPRRDDLRLKMRARGPTAGAAAGNDDMETRE
jgi:hypothetical protein